MASGKKKPPSSKKQAPKKASGAKASSKPSRNKPDVESALLADPDTAPPRDEDQMAVARESLIQRINSADKEQQADIANYLLTVAQENDPTKPGYEPSSTRYVQEALESNALSEVKREGLVKALLRAGGKTDKEIREMIPAERVKLLPPYLASSLMPQEMPKLDIGSQAWSDADVNQLFSVLGAPEAPRPKKVDDIQVPQPRYGLDRQRASRTADGGEIAETASPGGLIVDGERPDLITGMDQVDPLRNPSTFMGSEAAAGMRPNPRDVDADIEAMESQKPEAREKSRWSIIRDLAGNQLKARREWQDANILQQPQEILSGFSADEVPTRYMQPDEYVVQLLMLQGMQPGDIAKMNFRDRLAAIDEKTRDLLPAGPIGELEIPEKQYLENMEIGSMRSHRDAVLNRLAYLSDPTLANSLGMEFDPEATVALDRVLPGWQGQFPDVRADGSMSYPNKRPSGELLSGLISTSYRAEPRRFPEQITPLITRSIVEQQDRMPSTPTAQKKFFQQYQPAPSTGGKLLAGLAESGDYPFPLFMPMEYDRPGITAKIRESDAVSAAKKLDIEPEEINRILASGGVDALEKVVGGGGRAASTPAIDPMSREFDLDSEPMQESDYGGGEEYQHNSDDGPIDPTSSEYDLSLSIPALRPKRNMSPMLAGLLA